MPASQLHTARTRARSSYRLALRRRPGIPRIALLLAAVGAVLLAPGRSSASGPVQLTLTSPATAALNGLPLKVEVNVSNVTGLTGWTTDLNTDPAKLTYAGLTFQNTFLQSTGRTASCFGPTQFFLPTGVTTTTDTAPAATTVDVSMIGPFTAGLPAIVEYTPVSPSDGGGGVLPNGGGGAALVSGGGAPVTYSPSLVTDTSKAWTPGQWIGEAVRSGANFATITSNTATALSLSPNWSPATPSTGATYQIVQAITYTATTLTDPSRTQLSVTSITRSVNTATVTTSAAHGYTTGQSVTISGAAPAPYNGTFSPITVTDTTHFTYTVTGTPASPATGTITYSASPAWAVWGSNKVVRSGANFATITANTGNGLTFSAGWFTGPGAGSAAPPPVLGDPYTIVDAITYTSNSMTDPSKNWSVAPVQIWEGATVSSGTNSAVVTSHTATTLTVGPWTTPSPLPTKGDAYFIDFGPPLATSETMTVTDKPTGSGLDPGPLTVTRGAQTRGGAGMQGFTNVWSNNSLTDNTATWVPNEFVGASVTVGANSGVVASNSKTKLNLTANWSPAQPAGSQLYTLRKIFPTGATLKVTDPSRTGMTCGSDWFNPPPTPPGPDGAGLLASLTFTTRGLTPSTSITWGGTTQVTATGGAQAFTTTPLNIKIVPCPVSGGVKKIGFTLFSAMLNSWNKTPASGTPPYDPIADIDSSGKVDFVDFSIMLAYWNQTCP